MPTTVKSIRDAIATKIGALSLSNGESVTIRPENIKDIYIRTNTTSDADYPRACILPESGDSNKMPSGRRERKDLFRVLIVLREGANGLTDVHSKILELVDDVEKKFVMDDSLGDLVQDVDFKGYSTDGGATYPEAMVLFLLEVTWYRTL